MAQSSKQNEDWAIFIYITTNGRIETFFDGLFIWIS